MPLIPYIDVAQAYCCGLKRLPEILAVGTFLLLMVFYPEHASAQEETKSASQLRGFVTHAATGQSLELVNVVILEEDRVVAGVVTNRDGLYLTSLPSGRYRVMASFIGFETFSDSLVLEPGAYRTLNIALQPTQTALDEILIETERADGAARIVAGKQTIRPEAIERIPSPDVSGDLAGYLTTLPGVVTTGDQGGQLFIRGGEPSQNLVLLDGMPLYQPFHILGFYSAFPSGILNRVDLYAGGYPARFGERISSVLDVRTRDGNKQRVAGSVSLSPFVSAVQLEGPLLKDRLSALVSVRRSMVEQWAEPLADEPLPFRFGDAFAKLSLDVSPTSRLTVSGIATHDRGRLREASADRSEESISWQNYALGARYLFLPRQLPLSASIALSASGFDNELGDPASAARTASVRDIQLDLAVTYYAAKWQADFGMVMRQLTVAHEIGGLFQNLAASSEDLAPFALYAEPELTFVNGLRVRAGLRMQLYEVRVAPLLEPRLRAVWDLDRHQVSAAFGLYYQELMGFADRRDAAGIFTVWSTSPRRLSETLNVRQFLRDENGTWRLIDTGRGRKLREGNAFRSVHSILGYRTAFRGFAVAIEAFYRSYGNLFVPEWTPFPQLTTNLQLARGRTAGFDVRLEWENVAMSGSVGYGYANTRYEVMQASLAIWLGNETIRFHPAHDRQHQVSAVIHAAPFGFDFDLRWTFGSGLPFTQVLAFDGYALVDDLGDVGEKPGERRVIYDRPFGARLPTYHRLDVSLGRMFSLGRIEVTVQGSLINAYDRSNLFYLDTFTAQRVDQLPLLPSFGLQVSFP